MGARAYRPSHLPRHGRLPDAGLPPQQDDALRWDVGVDQVLGRGVGFLRKVGPGNSYSGGPPYSKSSTRKGSLSRGLDNPRKGWYDESRSTFRVLAGGGAQPAGGGREPDEESPDTSDTGRVLRAGCRDRTGGGPEDRGGVMNWTTFWKGVGAFMFGVCIMQAIPS